MISNVFKVEKFKNNEKLSGSHTIFRLKVINDIQVIVPDQSQIWENSTYKTVKWFDKYDDRSRLIESHGVDGIISAVLYGYGDKLPVASVINARHKDIFYTSFEEDNNPQIIYNDAFSGDKSYSGTYTFNSPEYLGPSILSYRKKNGNIWEQITEEISYNPTITIPNGQIDDIRVYPVNAFINTITHKPLIGKTSVTNANGQSVFYEYDHFGRLIKVYDQDKNLIKRTEYNSRSLSEETYSIFSIVPNIDLIVEGCEVNLSAEPMVPPSSYNDIEFHWYYDYDRLNEFSTEMEVTVTPTSQERTYYLTTIENGYTRDISTTLTLSEPVAEIDLIYITLNFDEGGGTETRDIEYTGCDEEGWYLTITENDEWEDYGWLSYQYDYDNNKVTFTCDEVTDPQAETEIMQVNVVNANGDINDTFEAVRRTDLVIESLTYTEVNVPPHGIQYRLYASTYGGAHPLEYSWTVNGEYLNHNERTLYVSKSDAPFEIYFHAFDQRGQHEVITITID